MSQAAGDGDSQAAECGDGRHWLGTNSASVKDPGEGPGFAGPEPAGPEAEFGRAKLGREQRLERESGLPGLLPGLARLSPSDLQSLLLDVMRERASDVTPAALLRQYRQNRFVRPARLDARGLRRLELLAYDSLPADYEPLELSPVAPLGACGAVAPQNQDRIVSALRGLEVASDATNQLVLEAALRRQAEPHRPVGLAASQRHVRAQPLTDPRHYPHFRIFALVTAGRDEGDHRFELRAVAEHLACYARLAERAGLGAIRVRLTDWKGGLADRMEFPCELYPERQRARGYYHDLCFLIDARLGDEWVEIGDGGLVDWTRQLLQNRKERLVTSGVALERMLEGSSPARA